MKRFSGTALVLAAVIVFLEALVWRDVIFAHGANGPRLRFLDVGQGDSELLVLPGNVKIMTDAGPDKTVTARLAGLPEMRDRYVDVAVISHPQLDHFGGFLDLVGRYRFGAFIVNGRSDSPKVEEWGMLVNRLRGQGVPVVVLGAGARIAASGASIEFLSPDGPRRMGKELNDTGLVEYLRTPRWTALLAADIGPKVEAELVRRGLPRVDVLKLPHHGSKFSSSAAFLAALSPRIAVAEVGLGNSYKHPAAETLARLAALGFSRIFRTDRNGTVTVSDGATGILVTADRADIE